MLPVAILAGGLATRIRPVTETIPKALIDIAGEPFAFHQLRLLRRCGIENVVYCVGYLGEMISEVVGDGSRFGISLTYSFDGPSLLGTGGAIRQALPYLGEDFFVLYGDSYLDIDYRLIEEAYIASNMPALMTVFRNEGRWDKSNVEFSEGRINKYSKTDHTPLMTHIDYGLGILSKNLFNKIPPSVSFDLSSIYEDLADSGLLAAFEVRQRFYEVGSFLGIEELSTYLKKTGES